MRTLDFWPRVFFVSVTSRKVYHHAVRPDGRRYGDEWVAECSSKIEYVAPMGALIPITWAAELGGRPCRRCRWSKWIRDRYVEVAADA